MWQLKIVKIINKTVFVIWSLVFFYLHSWSLSWAIHDFVSTCCQLGSAVGDSFSFWRIFYSWHLSEMAGINCWGSAFLKTHIWLSIWQQMIICLHSSREALTFIFLTVELTETLLPLSFLSISYTLCLWWERFQSRLTFFVW